jgi:hypothetical protein
MVRASGHTQHALHTPSKQLTLNPKPENLKAAAAHNGYL